MGFEWLYFHVGPTEPKIWPKEKNRKESILTNAKSMLKFADKIADIGDKSANRRNTNCDPSARWNLLTPSLQPHD